MFTKNIPVAFPAVFNPFMKLFADYPSFFDFTKHIWSLDEFFF